MSNTVIVAIPPEDDYVWRISSEKIPHMTILSLGDQSNNPRLENMVEFIQHVVDTSLFRFGLGVDRRGTLGPDDADVVFFETRDWEFPEIKAARQAMLENADIRAAYNSSEQFPEWTPHLTLGFPATPAKTNNLDYQRVSWVRFDKIAIWTGDFSGPEFELKENRGLDIAMSELDLRDLRHHGVRGQKWGVRRAERNSSSVTLRANPGGRIKTTGGKGLKPHKDATSAAVSRQKARKSKTHALSNEELGSLVKRMNLEQQYSRLEKSDPNLNRGSKFVKRLLGQDNKSIGEQHISEAAAATSVAAAIKKKYGVTKVNN